MTLGCTRSALVLELAGVTRLHGGRPVWAPLDLSVAAGTLSVVTGVNGSGKSTLLRLAAGLLRPSAGTRWCDGRALYVRGGGGLRSAQTVAAAVATTATLAGRREAAPAALALLRMHGFADRRVGTLSAGERVRVALAAAWAADPALLCLDEPTAVLDEAGVRDLVEILGCLRENGCATLVATHQPADLLPAADAHLLLVGGRVTSG
ncbi:MAG: ATP-binding cassette domain-containing protein [Mycobacteriales bacterium]